MKGKHSSFKSFLFILKKNFDKPADVKSATWDRTISSSLRTAVGAPCEALSGEEGQRLISKGAVFFFF